MSSNQSHEVEQIQQIPALEGMQQAVDPKQVDHN